MSMITTTTASPMATKCADVRTYFKSNACCGADNTIATPAPLVRPTLTLALQPCRSHDYTGGEGISTSSRGPIEGVGGLAASFALASVGPAVMKRKTSPAIKAPRQGPSQ